jgi:hypothetical protein
MQQVTGKRLRIDSLMLENDWAPRSALDIFVKDMLCIFVSNVQFVR